MSFIRAIYRITLPLPGRKHGPVNVYLLKGRDNVTLLDTGIFFTVNHLKTVLATAGLRFRDLDRVVLTTVMWIIAVRFLVRKNRQRIKVCAHPEEIESIQTGAEAPLKA